MSDDKDQQLLASVPEDGRRMGNKALRRLLGWDDATYWEVRNRLVDRGLLEIGGGQGGSVRRPVISAVSPDECAPAAEAPSKQDSIPPPDAREPRSPELSLYNPVARTLEEKWAKDKRVESAIVQITALQGRRYTGGRWTRPDVTVATLSTFPYVPGRHFDVITFEIKPCDAIDVTAVYEALAHLRSATRAYVLLHVPESVEASLEEVLAELTTESRKHGIGLIVMRDPSDYDTWDERVEAQRTDFDPQRVNDFLAAQFDKDQLERIVRWFR